MDVLIRNVIEQAHKAELRVYLARERTSHDHYGFFTHRDKDYPIISFHLVRGGGLNFTLNYWPPSNRAGVCYRIRSEADSVTSWDLLKMLDTIPPNWSSLPNGWKFTRLDDYLNTYKASKHEPIWMDGPWPYVACRLERDGWCYATREEKQEAARLMGIQSAREHQDEYPGDTVIADWNSEWWSDFVPDILHSDDCHPAGELWGIFNDALFKEVTRLTDTDVVY